MPLAPGHRLGIYQIVGTLGAGGMGEVYRAHDTALHRDVAIKVLPDVFAGDPERLQRLTREARALAALNHPNIAHVHGLDDTGSGRALIMELVEGEDLSQRIARGPLPLEDTLPIARQIAEALEAAHEQGIVHRDLKPANIKIRPDRTVKVLDFGLAKVTGPEPVGSRAVGDSQTFTSDHSEHGIVLGTAAYMAPEQARGQAVDKRADIWAFGVVLYEMLTGTRAFRGERTADVLAAVVRREIDWSKLPADTPPGLRHLLERCLTIDVKQRLRDIGEARVALERGPDSEVTSGPRQTGSEVTRGPRPSGRGMVRLLFAVAVIGVGAAVFFGTRLLDTRTPPDSNGTRRSSVLAPPGTRLNLDSANVALSPDGRTLAFVIGPGVAAENQLWVRPLDSLVARRIESGDGAVLPFWSPDSTRIAFFAQRKLKVVAPEGGPSYVICDTPFARGGTWGRDGTIVFAPDAQGPLYRVPATGGTPTLATALDGSRQQQGHRFPFFLPDGDRFLYVAVPARNGAFDVIAGSLRQPSAAALVGSFETAVAYAGPGWLLFGRQGVLAAQRFDTGSLQLRGDPIPLGDEPGVAPSPGTYEAGPRVSVGPDDALAYYQPAGTTAVLQWMDAAGKPLAIVGLPPGRYTHVSLAPDGKRAVLLREEPGATSTLWLVDLARAGAVPLVAEGRNTGAVWSPDGTQIVFASERQGRRQFYVKNTGDSSPEQKLAEFDDRSAEPRGWSADGKWILFHRVDPGTRWNIYRLRAEAGSKPEALVNGPHIEVGARTSPDGRWLAYLSDETGRLDMFVRLVEGNGPKVQVSTGGVQFGWWTPDARHLLFTKHDRTLWRIPIDLTGDSPRVGAPQQLGAFPPGIVAIDRAGDGRFLALVSERTDAGSITIVQSWQSGVPPPK